MISTGSPARSGPSRYAPLATESPILGIEPCYEAMNRLPAFALIAILAGCAGYSMPPKATPSPVGSERPTSAPTDSPSPAPAASDAPAEIEILISGGPHDGSYRAVANDACHYAPAQNNFTVNYA